MTPQEIGTAYLAATVTSVAIAVSLTRLVPRLPVSPSSREILGKLVPFVSVASAGIVNISCIRWKEMKDGIEVYKLFKNEKTGVEDKEVLGKSSKAGQLAVGQSAASRVFTNVPTLIIPPLAMTFLQNRGTFNGPRGKVLSQITNLAFIGLALGLFLPPAIAYFPQRAQVDPKKLEEEFRDQANPVYFNKGL